MGGAVSFQCGKKCRQRLNFAFMRGIKVDALMRLETSEHILWLRRGGQVFLLRILLHVISLITPANRSLENRSLRYSTPLSLFLIDRDFMHILFRSPSHHVDLRLTLILQAKEVGSGHSFLTPLSGLHRDLSLTVTVSNAAARLLVVDGIIIPVTFCGLATIVSYNDLGRSFTQVQALLGVIVEALLFILLDRRIHTRPSALVVRIGPPVAAVGREPIALHAIGALLQVPDVVAARPVASPELPGCQDSSVGSIST